MKLSLKIKLLTLILLPFFTCAAFYWYTINMDEVINNFPTESSINFANTSKDIDKIKKLAIMSLENYQSSHKNNVKTFYNFVDLLLAVAVFNAILIYSIYKCFRRQFSNKRVKSDAQ